MSPFSTALRLHDRFVLRERIGRGGMSEVWRADDEVLHRPVAVKALAGQLAADPELRATIQREARAAARLTHPHVTQVYDYGEATLSGGVVVPYLVMELVDGESLADRLARGPLAWPDAVRLGGEVAAALAAAHRIGVVHRDIKPGNVMLTDTGAKVLDFGIAALVGPHHALAGQSGGELLMGTPAYTAPERLAAGPPDPASDVYALGAVLYQALTGRAPLPVHNWRDALAVHVQGTLVPPTGIPELPTQVERLVLACLAADPADRPTATEVAARLGAGRPEHPPTTVLPTLPATPATAHPATMVQPAPPATPATAHPPTMVDRSAQLGPMAPAGWPSVPVVDPAGATSSRPPAAGPTAWPPATVTSSRPPAAGGSRRSDRTLWILVAAGVALLVGLVGVFAVDGDPDGRRTGGPVADAPADPANASTRPAGTPSRIRPAPTTSAPAPKNLRQLADQFEVVIAEAQARGSLDAKAAERLRDKLSELTSGKPKERAKRVRELRERLGEAVEEEQIDAATAARLLAMLEPFGGKRSGDEADDD